MTIMYIAVSTTQANLLGHDSVQMLMLVNPSNYLYCLARIVSMDGPDTWKVGLIYSYNRRLMGYCWQTLIERSYGVFDARQYKVQYFKRYQIGVGKCMTILVHEIQTGHVSQWYLTAITFDISLPQLEISAFNIFLQSLRRRELFYSSLTLLLIQWLHGAL